MEKYSAKPEYLWAKFPDYAVFRHSDNNKWFGIIMSVSYEKIDSHKGGMVDILNIKAEDLLMRDFLVEQEGYYYGYHISRGNWVSIVLDGTVPIESIQRLIDVSYRVTASKKTKLDIRPPKEWLIPSNPKYYDIVQAFDNNDIIDWKQGKGIKTGDTVFMYVGSPISAILYKCKVVETDIPYEYRDKSLTIKHLMKIQLEKKYSPDSFTFDRLKSDYNIFAVRGPRGVPVNLSNDLNNY